MRCAGCAGRIEVPVFRREDLLAGHRITGPAIVAEAIGTSVVEAGWTAEVDAEGNEVRAEPRQRAEDVDAKADPIMLEVFSNLFMSIAEQMGPTLANTACSVNIRERLDFSCALFDASGNLVATRRTFRFISAR